MLKTRKNCCIQKAEDRKCFAVLLKKHDHNDLAFIKIAVEQLRNHPTSGQLIIFQYVTFLGRNI